MENKLRLLRITTVPISLKFLLKGQLLFMQQNGFEVLAVSADGKERNEVMQHEKVNHVVVPMTRIISPVQDLVSLIKLIGVIREFKPSIVHTHTPKAGLLGMMAAFICRVPLRLHTVAGLPLMESKGLKKKLLLFTEWLTYFCAHRVYPNSFGLYDFIMETFGFKVESSKLKVQSSKLKVESSKLKVEGSRFGVPGSRFKVIGKGSSNGIDTTYFSRRADVEAGAKKIRDGNNIDDSSVTFSFVGRVVNDKGIEELLMAFDRLSKIKKVKLILVGPFEDELDPITEKSKSILKSNSNIIAAGFQNDVRPFIAASDIFVFPSYREGFPNVVMQACCLEVPCIVSDINGCNEIIAHHETGLIIKPKDVEGLYDAMLLLTENDSLRKEFGEKSRRFVVENFDQGFVWGELLKEYQLTAETRRRGGK